MTTQDKFNNHKKGAKARGIPFHLTFDEWWDIWQQSGHWEERGRKKDQYVMSRFNDTGPYDIGNVFIQTQAENMAESRKLNPRSPFKGHESPNKGKTNLPMHSEESRAKMAASLKGNIPWNKGRTDLPKQTEEHKRKNAEGVRAAAAKRKGTE